MNVTWHTDRVDVDVKEGWVEGKHKYTTLTLRSVQGGKTNDVILFLKPEAIEDVAMQIMAGLDGIASGDGA